MTSNMTSDGSPTPRKSRFAATEGLRVDTSPDILGMAGVKRPNSTARDPSIPLISSSRGNLTFLQQQQQAQLANASSRMASDGYKKLKVDTAAHNDSVVDSLLQRLSDHSSPLEEHNGIKNPGAGKTQGLENHLTKDYDNSSNGSNPITPATDGFVLTPSTDGNSQPIMVNSSELQKLRNDLEHARNEVARINQELHTTHLAKSTLDHTIGQSSETDYGYYKGDVTEQTISQLQNQLNASTRTSGVRQGSWLLHEDGVFNKADPKFANGQAIWGNEGRDSAIMDPNAMNQPYAWGNDTSRPFQGNNTNAGMGVDPHAFGPIQPQRPSTGQQVYRGRNAYLNEAAHFPLDQTYRGAYGNPTPPTRPGSAFDAHRWNNYLAPPGDVGNNMYGPSPVPSFQSRPIGNLSPEAAEFNVDAIGPTPWNNQSANCSHYVAPAEPMNYRRLLDRNMSCNWKYIVDKIICNNDQQASIFLQQKLKVGTAEQKYEIVEAIIAQAYPLMINRFGNFLVQRCFEHGTPDQVIAIAGAIRGNTLTLSMDASGCHVVQKAFDAVPEEYKATMVHELLRRIPETVIHRYACHVWQKLFELRWSGSPPQIMRYVNEALRGMWHEVALGETGSLVVQNIFENCLEEDKRPCIEEVLASIDVISHGQFGNWCIQHICEHGAPTDRSRAIEHIIRLATEYSVDQYASKVIEKCLKVGGNEFLDRYLERVCEGRADRPRMPLIDIAGDQFGNYLIQYILTNCGSHHRELVASHVRKHMVSLRGSKYGSRVAMLCCNPALATRPGPPAGMSVSRYNNAQNIHRGGGYGGFR